MKLLKAVFVGSLIAFAIGVKAVYGATPTIYIVNHSQLPTVALTDALPAFQAAVDQDFGSAWNIYATLKLATQAPVGAWEIDIVDSPACWACGGYHKVNPGHVPYGEVGYFPDWQLIFSHELFEMLADPYADRGTYIKHQPYCSFDSCHETTAIVYALEVADPVEYIHWAYNRRALSGRNVVISDFVLPRWYDCQGGGPLDFVGHIKHCRHVLYGGYQYLLQNDEWTSDNHYYEYRR